MNDTLKIQPIQPSHEVSDRYRLYVAGLLTVGFTFNDLDRQILVILQEPLKAELGLSDAQLGLLSGFSFAIFYVTAGIPIARWADLGNRRNIVALAITVWSGMTVLSGLARSYWHLLAARIGVGIGEAGGSPPAHSIISDYFPFEKRGTALSVYSLGINLGVLGGFLIGGWVAQLVGWRAAFLVVGPPGLIVALLVRFTIREPMRGLSERRQAADAPSFRQTIKVLWGLRSFRYLALGSGFVAWVGYGNGNFIPSFLVRTHGLSVAAAGTILALAYGIVGGLGALAGGALADRLGARDRRWYCWIPALSALLLAPFSWAALFVESTTAAVLLMLVPIVGTAAYLAPTIAISHALVTPTMRAMVSAILFFVLNLIGLGLGPLGTGLMSDLLQPRCGGDSLRVAMAVTASMGLVAALMYWLAGRRLAEDLERSG